MLEVLYIHNFQSHRRRRIVLDPEVTTLLGGSDVGKSATVRALRWLALNTPSGASFISHGADETTVAAKVDGRRVERRRGKSANEYRVGKKVYKSFGATPPDDVQKLFNLSPLNFQRQHEAPFWFALTPGQVAKELNQVVNLEVIDGTLAGLAKALGREKSTLRVAEGRKREARSRSRSLAWTRKAHASLSVIERLQAAIAEQSYSIRELSTLVSDASRAKKRLDTLGAASDELEGAVLSISDARALRTDIVLLADTLDTARSARRTLSRPLPDVSALKDTLADVDAAGCEVEELLRLVNAAARTEDKLCSITRKEKQATKRLAGLRLTTPVCPVCNRRWSQSPPATCTSHTAPP